MSITNKIGPPVEGDDFFGRGKELEQANKLLESNHSLLLSAPRRIGKSSFAKRLIEVERAKGWKCAYLNTWSERLTEYHEYESLARQILKSLSVKSEGMSRSSLFNILMAETDIVKLEEMDYKLSKVLEMLENDGYIVKRESIRSFRSPLLRDYWFSKFVQ